MTLEEIRKRQAELIEEMKAAGNDTALTFARISGYYRQTQNFNDGKAQEYKDRENYSI